MILTLCFGIGCGGDDLDFHLPATTANAATMTPQVDAGRELVAGCDGASDGTPCRGVGRNMHCLFDACVANSCGDGIKAGLEECDDGNERDRDGCDSRCKVEPPPGCGNGVKEPAEECDDGNTSNRDQCTARCTVARCGDALVSLGEECDDGNRTDDDGCTNRCRMRSGSGAKAASGAVGASAGRSGSGNGPPSGGNSSDTSGTGGTGGTRATSGTGSATSGTGASMSGSGGTSAGALGTTAGAGGEVAAGSGGTSAAGTRGAAGDAAAGAGAGGTAGSPAVIGGHASAECVACRNAMCRDYEMSGIDVVSGCFTAVNDTFGAMANDPTFLQQCMAVVDCAYQNGCGGAPRGLSACYCGSADETSCIMNGPAEDAKCVPQIKAASRTELNTDISMRFSDFAYPLGWALNLLDCDHKYCAATCGP